MKYSISLAILLFSTVLCARENFRAAKDENSDRTPSTVSSVNANLPSINIEETDAATEATMTPTEATGKAETKKVEKPDRH